MSEQSASLARAAEHPPLSKRRGSQHALEKGKRLKTYHLAAQLKPELQFKELNIDEAEWKNRNDKEKFSAHADSAHNLYVSDTTCIVCFSQDGSYRPVVRDIEPHHIVPNGTADFVVILRKSDKQKLSRVTADGTVRTILETNTPLFGPDVCPNGDVVHHPSTSRLERQKGLTGELSGSIEGGRGKVISFEANSYLAAGQDGNVYFSSKTCIFRWNTMERTVECIAGHPKIAGGRDGFGTDARFTHLKRPVITRRFAYVRESDNRFCRVDLETFEVATLQMRGVDPSSIETYGVTPDGQMMFLIFTQPFRIFTAETTDCLESTFCADMQRVDWTGASGARFQVDIVAGKERRVYRADGRILEARSAYFRLLLSGGMKEATNAAPIDLGEDVGGDALEAMLHFLHTDHFEPVSPPSRVLEMGDAEALRLARFTLEVHTLADRFLLPRLGRLCEVFLADFALRAAIAVPILAGITSPRRPCLANLEAACWEFLEQNWKEITSCHHSALQELVEQSHPLAVELLQAASGVKRSARKAEDDAPAAA